MSNADRCSDPSTQAGGAEGSGHHRLSNLVKLYHVPVFALRELLQSRGDEARFSQLRQADLVRKAEEMETITEDDVAELYENYRYGRRLTFYLYVLPHGLTPPDVKAMQTILEELTVLERDDLLDEFAPDDDYEDETPPRQITLLDEERLDGLREIRFRYYVTHRFLNASEQADQVLQSRYGFLWLDLNLGYLAILSRDERVNGLLTQALARCLQAVPEPVRFPKELLDKHFSIERAKRLSYYDPSTGVHRSISGHGLWQRFEHEIMAREQQYARPSSMYDEQIADGLISGLGVSASKGKIYLTKTLPTSVVRAWARQRLPELVRDVKALRAEQLDSVKQSLDTITRARLTSPGKAAILAIVEGLLQTEREGLSSTSLPLTALEIYEALDGKYFTPYFRTQCSRCDETAELCPYCESRNVELEGQQVLCRDCGATLSDGQSVTLRCMNGHVTTAPQAEIWNIAPNHWLQKRMVRIFAELGQSWDEKNDYFHVEGKTLYRLRRGEIEGVCLPHVIQNYISNFWDPVTGQVHAGSGDIVVATSPEGEAEPVPPVQPGATFDRRNAPRLYKGFDLWLRGTAAEGYTVEAAASVGGRLPPQPVLLPRDQAFWLRVGGIFDQAAYNGNLQALGKALFNALFPMPVRRLWADAVGSLTEDEGLRIALRIAPPELLHLPWELLFEDQYLALGERFSMVRYLDLQGLPRPLAIQPPLSLLLVQDQPAGIEADGLRQLAAQQPDKVKLEVWAPTGSDELLSRLRRGYHTLHYVGQATVQAAEGYLILAGPQGKPVRLQAGGLAQAVAHSNLRLAFLQSDKTGAGTDGAFHTVAQQMVQSGLPAAIAVPRSLPPQAALAFTDAFYRALCEGTPLEAALQQGRRQILAAHEDGKGADWALPALYMRTPDALIVGLPAKDVETHMKRREEARPTVTYTPTFHGPIHGPVHTGPGDIRIGSMQYGLRGDDLDTLFENLRALVEKQAPPDKKVDALKAVSELKKAIQEKKPDITRMEAILQWFKKYIPQLAGAVASVLVNPIVGKVVEAAGDLVAKQFRQRFNV